MAVRIVGILVLLVLLVLGTVYLAGTGVGLDFETAGSPSAAAASADVVADRGRRVSEAALDVGVARAKQVLFGDLHVHTTFSFDAFQMSLPMAGGDGAHPGVHRGPRFRRRPGVRAGREAGWLRD